MRKAETVVRLARCVQHRSIQRCYYACSSPPSQFSVDDLGKMYTISKEDVERLAFQKTLPSTLRKQINTLEECVTMIRSPLLEVQAIFQAVRPTFPAIRMCLWGKFGTGKSVTVNQAVHLASTLDWVVINHHSAMTLTRKVSEVEMSSYKSGRINDPEGAVAILQQFKQQNAPLWKRLSELKTHKEYEWTKNEKTAAGRPITELVDMGISAPFLASDCVGALFREIKIHASNDKIKVLVAVDDANSLWGKTLVKKADRTFASPAELTLVQHFRKLVCGNWSNGAVLLVADKKEISDARDKMTVPLYTPLELFGEEGFEAIEPFIPIETSNYTQKETDHMYDYFVERNWLASAGARSSVGKQQIAHLSAFNPYYYERLCAFN